MEILIIIGLALWVIGYFRVGKIVNDGLLVNKTYVRPPFIIYLLCGLPKAINIPAGIMAIPSLLLQLQGLLFLICGLIDLVQPDENLLLLGGFYILGTVFTIIYILDLCKNYSFKDDQHPEPVPSEEKP
jgi:hypothetical protein